MYRNHIDPSATSFQKRGLDAQENIGISLPACSFLTGIGDLMTCGRRAENGLDIAGSYLDSIDFS
jgi:hypothetical protein